MAFFGPPQVTVGPYEMGVKGCKMDDGSGNTKKMLLMDVTWQNWDLSFKKVREYMSHMR